MKRSFGAFVAVAFALALHAQPAEPAATTNAPALPVAPTVGPLSWSYGPYQYDPTGNITAIGAQYYVYDPMSRLVKASTAFTPAQQVQQVQDFTYDVYGNLTQMKTDGVPVSTMSVDPTTNRVTTLTYDAAGNVTSWQPEGSAYRRDYTYDALNRVVAEQVPNNPDVTYHVYTASDERYWTYSLHGGVAESHFKIRGMGAEVLRDFQLTGGTWTVFRDYVYRDGTLLASIAATGAQHISVDHLGSPRLVTDDARYRIGAHTYLPFGAEWTDGTVQEGDVLKFTGHERDRSFVASESNGLDYMHARYYSSGMGRFLSPDSLVVRGGRNPQLVNRYSYVSNSPLNSVDPLGLFECNTKGECVDKIYVNAPDPLREAREAAERDNALREAEFLEAATAIFNARNPLTNMTVREHLQASGYGVLAFVDGALPFGDPLESYYEGSGIEGLEYSQKVGEYTRDIELAIATTGTAGSASGLGLRAMRYPNAGGAGVTVLKNGRRMFGIDWHKFKLAGRMVNRPHFHAGKTASQISKHRPWQGGWKWW